MTRPAAPQATLPRDGERNGAAVEVSDDRGGATRRGLTRSVPALRILLVDDNVDAADVLAMLLQASGHAVATAHDGLQAVEMMSASRSDVVLLDIGLPKLDGYEVARRIRARYGNGIALVAITGWGQARDLRAAKEAGFDAHLIKPVDFRELTLLLAKVALSRVDMGTA